VHNDEAVAEDAYRQAAADAPGAWFAVGWLAGQRELSARRCGKALRAIAKAEPFWR
jgi:triphosphatase